MAEPKHARLFVLFSLLAAEATRSIFLLAEVVPNEEKQETSITVRRRSYQLRHDYFLNQSWYMYSETNNRSLYK